MVKFDSFPASFPEELSEEVMRMVHEIVSLKTQIIKVKKERDTLLSKRVGMEQMAINSVVRSKTISFLKKSFFHLNMHCFHVLNSF